MTTKAKRDFAADLAYANECQRTEAGLTAWNRESYNIATHAIQRAIEAEAKVDRLRKALETARHYLIRNAHITAEIVIDRALLEVLADGEESAS